MAGKKRTFDPLAAYGTVSPPERGAVFYQDGGYFNAGGQLVFEDHPATTKTVEVEETVVEVTDGQSTSTTKTVTTEVPKIEEGDPKDILTRWLKGELVLNHGAVRGYMKKAYGVVVASKEAIIDYLVNTANLVPAEQVNVKPAAVGK
jgi:hypothetical protein